MQNSRLTTVYKQEHWGKVLNELESEKIKLAQYDVTLLAILGNLSGKRVLDYGGGTGILAATLQSQGAESTLFDISPEMLEKASERLGSENVYRNVEDISNGYYDYLICNLVLCIVTEEEVFNIVNNIKMKLKEKGLAYIGFCNPLIFNIPESKLDFRLQTKHHYQDNHIYKKIKKEGNYEITESHRPIEWYVKVFKASGLTLEDTIFTPEYELNGRKIKDFVILKLSKLT